jgi:hypothetical protein
MPFLLSLLVTLLSAGTSCANTFGQDVSSGLLGTCHMYSSASSCTTTSKTLGSCPQAVGQGPEAALWGQQPCRPQGLRSEHRRLERQTRQPGSQRAVDRFRAVVMRAVAGVWHDHQLRGRVQRPDALRLQRMPCRAAR